MTIIFEIVEGRIDERSRNTNSKCALSALLNWPLSLQTTAKFPRPECLKGERGDVDSGAFYFSIFDDGGEETVLTPKVTVN